MALMQEPSVPERQSLEFSFVRARWVAAAAITLLLPIGGFHVAAAEVFEQLAQFKNEPAANIVELLKALDQPGD